MGDQPRAITVETLLAETEWIRAIACALLVDSHAAEDVTQETLLAALLTPPDRQEALRAWLRSTVRNIAHHVRRTERRRSAREQRSARPESIAPHEDLIERAELQRDLVDAVLQLEEPSRGAVLLRYFEGKNAVAIAAAEGIDPSVVRARLKRGLDRMRSRLDWRYGERSGWVAGLVPFLAPGGSVVAPSADDDSVVLREVIQNLAAIALTSSRARLLASIQVAAVLLPLLAGTWIYFGMPLSNWRSAHFPAPTRDGGTVAEVANLERTSPPTSDTIVGRDRRDGTDPDARDTASGTSASVTPPLVASAKTVPTVLHGVITHEYDGSPAPDLAIVITEERPDGDWPPRHEFHTDANGAWRLEFSGAVVLDRIRVFAGPRSAELKRELDLRIDAGETVRLDLEAPGGGALEGGVVGEEGEPIAGAVVHGWCLSSFEYDSGEPPWGRPYTRPAPHRKITADEKGRFLMEFMGRDFVVEAVVPDHVCYARQRGTVEEGETIRGLVIAMVPATRLYGRVVGLDTEPVAERAVSATVSKSSPYRPPKNVTIPRLFEIDPAPRQLMTDANGEFSFDGECIRPYSIVIAQPWHSSWSRSISCTDSPKTFQLDVGATLTGTVFSAAGVSLPGAKVSFCDYIDTLSDEHGRFELHEVPNLERSHLTCIATDHAVHVHVLPKSRAGTDSDVEIRLVPESVIDGTVVDEGGQPVAASPVEIEGDRVIDLYGRSVPTDTWERRAGICKVLTDFLGRFRFANLYQGEFLVTATHPADRTLHAEAKVATTRQDLKLILAPISKVRVTFRGTVRDKHTGTPIRSFTVSCMTPLPALPGEPPIPTQALPTGEPPSFSSGLSGSALAFDDLEGAFEVHGIKPGWIAIHVSAPGYSPFQRQASIYPAGEFTLEPVLVPSVAWKCRVLRRSDRSVLRHSLGFRDRDGNCLQIEISGGRSGESYPDDDGVHTLRGLPAEEIVVIVRSQRPMKTWELPVDVRNLPDSIVDLVVDTPSAVKFQAILFPGEPRQVRLHNCTESADEGTRPSAKFPELPAAMPVKGRGTIRVKDAAGAVHLGYEIRARADGKLESSRFDGAFTYTNTIEDEMAFLGLHGKLFPGEYFLEADVPGYLPCREAFTIPELAPGKSAALFVNLGSEFQ